MCRRSFPPSSSGQTQVVLRVERVAVSTIREPAAARPSPAEVPLFRSGRPAASQ